MKRILYIILFILIGCTVITYAYPGVSSPIKGLTQLKTINSLSERMEFLLLHNPQLSAMSAANILQCKNLSEGLSVPALVSRFEQHPAYTDLATYLNSEKNLEKQLKDIQAAVNQATGQAVTQQTFMSLSNGPEMLLAQTKLFISKNGFFPRLKIKDKTPDMYTEKDIQEMRLARRIRRFFASTDPYDPIRLALQQAQEKYTVGLSPLEYPGNYQYGAVSRQIFSQEINKAPDARDLANDFSQWLVENNDFILPTPETTKAIEALRVSTTRNAIDDNIYDILVKLNDMQLGYSDKETLKKVAYRGNTPALPQAKDFHEVIEIPGLTRWQNHVQKALQNDYSPITLYTNHNAVAGLILGEGTTAADVARVLKDLCPNHFEVRMTSHEFGIQEEGISETTLHGRLHLHIEYIAPSEGPGSEKPDINYWVWINAQALTARKTPHQIFKIYRDLFRPYMDEFMVNFTLP